MYLKNWFHLHLLKTGVLLESHVLHLQLFVDYVDPVFISWALTTSISLKRLLMCCNISKLIATSLFL